MDTSVTRVDEPIYRVENGVEIGNSLMSVHRVSYRKGAATLSSALAHFMAHHLRGRDIVSFAVDPATTQYACVYEELVILTKRRPYLHQGDM